MSPNGQIHARFLFNSREQAATESLDEFLNGLSSLSTKCQYEASPLFIQNLVRDRFVAGIRNKDLQARLIKCSDATTLNGALAIAKSQKLTIKQENQEEDNGEEVLPSLHDKLQVQVNEIQPDVKVTEETKIAILIELMNHKSILMAPSGRENKKAQLWSKIYKSLGTSFKSALHLREVFVTWKNLALQLRQQNCQAEDIKASNADKLIWDLFGQEDVAAQLEDYPLLNTGCNTNNDDVLDDIDDGNDELYTYEENDLQSSESHDDEEDSESEAIRPTRRGRGRPRKESPVRATSTSMSNDTKILVLRRLVLHKNILNVKGNEKEKKDMWKNLFNAFSKQLSLESPSALRGAFRIWKQRSMKKQDNPEETITESDKLIYQIFSPDSLPPLQTCDNKTSDQDLEDALEADFKEDQNFGLIAHHQKVQILKEISKFRDNIGVSVGNVYEKESAWRDVHQKIKEIQGLNNLSLKMLKALTKFWQSTAFHQAIKHGGPNTQVEKLMYHIYFINKNAAAPFANMPNGQPPPLQQQVPGCIHLTSDAKLSILKELFRSKSDLNKEETWERLCTTVKGLSVSKLRYAVKHWKARAIKLIEDEASFRMSKADHLLMKIYDLKADGALRDCDHFGEQVLDDDLSEEAKLIVAHRVSSQPWILLRSTKEKSRGIFWQSVIEELSRVCPNISSIDRLERSFWKWKEAGNAAGRQSSPAEKMASEVVDSIKSAESIVDDLTSEAEVAIINELFQNQEFFLLGNFSELAVLWDRIRQTLMKLGVTFATNSQLATAFTILKIRVRNRLRKNCHNMLSNQEKMILQLCVGGGSNTNFGMTMEGLSKSAKETLVPLICAQSEVLKHGDMQTKLSAWSDIHLKTTQVHNLQDTLSLVKLIKRWRMILLQKDELDELERSLMTSLESTSTDCLDSELLVYFEDSSHFDSQISHIFIPDFAKGVVTNSVMNRRDRVLCGAARELPNVWWEIMSELQNTFTVTCSQPVLLQRAYFAWTFEAWKKRSHSLFISPYEITMLDLACTIKSSESLFNGDLHNMSDIPDIPENILNSIIEDTIHYKELMLSNDKALFWSLVHLLGQAHSTILDNPQKLYAALLARCIKSKQRMEQNIPLTSFEITLLDFFGSKPEEEEEDECEDIYEAETMWTSLSENMTDKSRMAILKVLHQHSDIVAKRKRGLGDPQVVCDRIAIWQKALNVAIEEGVKIENHSKLMRMVREWREHAKRSQSEGKSLHPWEHKLLEIFDEQPIKEEAPDDDDETDDFLTNWENAGFITVPDPIRLVIAKAMLRHKLLLFNGKETHQDSGWRKVYRIAQANGAFYDSINGMRVSIGQWKMKALAKLSKDPKAITELDKLIYQIYDVDTGELDCEIIKAAADSDTTTIKLEPPISRLTTGGQLAILEEMYRLKAMLIEKPTKNNEISHKDRFYAWQCVLQVANAVGGNFSTILQLSTFIHNELKMPTLKKVHLLSKINEVDFLVIKIYDFEHNCQFEAEEFNIDNSQQSCRMCQVSFGRFGDLVLHQQVAHGQPQPILAGKCLTCGYDVGVGKAALRVHQRSKHSQEAFTCDFCDQTFFADEEFYVHVRDHVPYNPLETLEEIGEESDEDDDKNEAYGFGKQVKRRGLYRKRVKIEVQPPVTEEIPRIGKKEGGLCPHCGEVSLIKYGKFSKNHLFVFPFSTTSTSSNTLCTSMKPKSLGNVINVTMLMPCKKDCKNMYAIAILKKAT